MSIDWDKKVTVADKQEEAATQAEAALHEELDSLERENKVLIRCFVTLASTLIDKGVVSADDFSAEEKSLYQQLKAKKEVVYP